MKQPVMQHLDDGRIMISAPFGACDLPSVRSIDLNSAWQTASEASEATFDRGESSPEGVLFHTETGDIIDFEFDDYDALCWAAAIHHTFDLTTIRGLSLCFRMLALYQLMAKQNWARPLFTFDRRKNLKIDKALLSAAAITPLLENGTFDGETIRREIGSTELTNQSETLRL